MSRFFNRRSIRLQGYDYSSAGSYFVTLCTKNRKCLFGQLVDSQMDLTEGGEIARDCWLDIPMHYPMVVLDEYIIMPNHVHGIITIIADNGDEVRVQNFEPLQMHKIYKNKFQKIIPRSLGSIIRGFKIGVTKWFRQRTGIYHVWQRNYFERVIRNEGELNRVREYIFYNPRGWEEDRHNPTNRK